MGTDTDRHFIERMRWDEVARRIGDGAVAILPIGAAAKQHGFHLPLNTDRIQAEWLAGRMAEKIDALIWPTLTYGHYPAFVEYAGSSSLSISTFEALVREIAAADSRQRMPKAARAQYRDQHAGAGRPRAGAPRERAGSSICGSTKVRAIRRVARQLAEQSHGSHADELETSLMLALAPHLVDMTRAEASPALKQETPGALTPSDPNSPNYSRSGSYGDPTRATSAKGEALLAAMLDDLHEQAAAFIAQGPEQHRSAAVQSVLR